MGYPKVIGLDFDGTCVKNEYPKVGGSIQAEKLLVHLHKTYNIQYMLWTMRTGPELEAAVKWFEDNDIPLWGINNNPEQARWSTSPKNYANLYVDDTALGMPLIEGYKGKPYVDWSEAGVWLEDWCNTHAGRRFR
jgi:hypothetical protein